MKYIYFVSPNENSFAVYKMKMFDNFDSTATTTIRTGYNDPYEMRTQYLSKPWWSDNFEDMKKILEERKQKRISKVYDIMVKLMQESFDEERVTKHDGKFCPL